MKPFDEFLRQNLEMSLRNKKILIGITGSIAAFKICDLIRYLTECGAQTRVVLTESAEKFVSKLTLETLSQNKVESSLWTTSELGTHHISASRWADVAVIAPATANFIAKLAVGLADDLLTTELLAFQGSVLIAPAMNPAMFENQATKENIHKLLGRGVRFIGPNQGLTACREEGLGRMAEPTEILEAVAQCFYKPKNSKKILITVGPTRSYLDPIRFLTNHSSGKMGAAIAWQAVRLGYSVTMISGPQQTALPSGASARQPVPEVQQIFVTSTQEMFETTKLLWSKHDIFIGTAAVLDWSFKNKAAEKIKKDSLKLDFELSPDILSYVAKNRTPEQKVIGFAAETSQALNLGVQKLKAKGCDALFINDVSMPGAGFNSMTNHGWWITSEKAYELKQQTKVELAEALLLLIEGKVPTTVQSLSRSEFEATA